MGSGTSQYFDHLYLQGFFVTRPYTKTGMFYEIICTSKILATTVLFLPTDLLCNKHFYDVLFNIYVIMFCFSKLH